MEVKLGLKELYVFEVFKLALYESQLNTLQDQFIEKVYERIINTEQQHIAFYEQSILNLGGDIPKISGDITYLTREILNCPPLDLSTAKNRYKVGIAVENKAIEMHRTIIMKAWKYPELCKELWYNMVDEEFHLLWFKDSLRHLKSQHFVIT